MAAAGGEPDGIDPSRHARPGAAVWFLGLLLALGLLWTLRATVMVSLPLACALLIALAVWPVCEAVQRRVSDRLGWLGYVAAMLVVVGFLALFVAGLSLAARQVVSGAQQYIPQIQEMVSGSGLGGIASGEQLQQWLGGAGSYALGLLNAIWKTVAGLVLVFFLVLLMLTEARDWRTKLTNATGWSDSRWADAGTAIGQRFRRYFLTRLMLGALTAVLYAVWLSLFGLDFLFVWAMLALLLNFVPTVGSLIAGAFPVIFAFLSKDPGTAAIVAAGLLVIEQVIGNFVDPKLMGKRLSISPLMILVSLLVWSWVWGVPGALIAVPLTVLITVLFAHIPALKPVALFFSNDRDIEGLEVHTAPFGRGQHHPAE